ncbi:hypothetical protein CY35_05G097600, partial [Sphagnum magellanicum]
MGNEKRMEKDWLLWGSNLLTRRTTKMLIQDALLTRFEDEKTRQDRVRREFFAKKVEEMLLLRTQQRDLIFEQFHQQQHAIKIKEQYAIAMQRALRASWHNILGLEFFAEEKRIKMESTITHFDEAESIAAAKDIVAFESKGYELGAEDQVVVSPTPRKGSKKQDAKKPLPPPPKKTSKSALKTDSEALLHSPVHDSQAMQQKGLAFMEDVKTRKLKEMADKLQLKEKQNQELLQQQQEQSLKAQEEAQKRKVEEEAAIDTAKKAAAEEHNIWEAEQKIELDRRLLQEKEIEAQRSTEWNVIRNQEHELFMMLFNDIADEIDKEFNEWQESITQVAKKRRAKHHHFCFDIILQ